MASLNRRTTVGGQSRVAGVEKFTPTDIFRVRATGLSKEDLFSLEGDYQSKLEKLGGVQGILERVQSEANTGIMGDESDLDRRRSMFGENVKPRPQLPAFKDSLQDALNDRILFITAIFAFLSIIFGMIYHPKTGWREGTFIIIALFIQVLITALNDHSKDTQFVRLQLSALDEELPVVRGKAGAMQTINIWDLVVGDVVMLNRGDKAPADCVIIEAINCVVDERNVVESDVSGSVEKKAEDRLFAGSYLTSGEAKVVVCAVGAHSSRGDVDELHDTRDQDTTLTRKLDKIGGSLKFIGLIAAISILVLSMVVLLITVGSVDGKEFLKKFVDNLTLALIILIVAIPEGIPMTVGVSLAYSVLYMYDNDHLLVRDLTAVETLGLVDELVMGKTGTMTTEEMQVVSFYIQDQEMKNARKDTLLNCHINEDILEKLKESIIFNSSAYIEMTDNSFYVPVGNGTEVSLIKWLQDAEIPAHEIIRQKAGNVIYSHPFDSELKKSVIAVQHPGLNDTVRVYVKGAPETVVENCSRHYKSNGELDALSYDQQNYVMENIMTEKMAKLGHRVMAFAVNDFDSAVFEQLRQDTNNFTSEDTLAKLELGKTFLALVGLKDPQRDSIRDTLSYANRAGIKLRLVSGDHFETCRAFACDVGLITKEQYDQGPDGSGDYAIDARKLREEVGGIQTVDTEDGVAYAVKDMERFRELMTDMKVVTRATPEDKLLIVSGLQALDDQKVAIIGDGIAEIKAFTQADVSFAMGSGSSLNRNTASIVVTDDNVESVMRGFMWGRNIWLNVQRFLTFQMTCNFACLVTIVIGYCFLTESPLSAVQLIWINLVMDIIGAITLSSVVPNTEDCTQPIVADKVLHTYNYRAIYGNATWMILIMMLAIFSRTGLWDIEKYDLTTLTECSDDPDTAVDECAGAAAKKMHLTLIFTTFMFLQIFNLLNAKQVNKKKLNPFTNLLFQNWFVAVIALGLAVFQYVLCFLWIGVIFEIAPVDETIQFTTCVALGASVLASAALLKYVPERLAVKLPVLNEDEALGSNTGLMKAYDQQAQAKAFDQKKGGKGGPQLLGGDDSQDFQELDP